MYILEEILNPEEIKIVCEKCKEISKESVFSYWVTEKTFLDSYLAGLKIETIIDLFDKNINPYFVLNLYDFCQSKISRDSFAKLYLEIYN